MGVYMENLVINYAQQDKELLIESTSRLSSEGAKFRGSYTINDKKQDISDALKNDRRKLASFMSNPIFRTDPKGLTEKEVLDIIIKNDFFDKNRNHKGNGFSNRFETLQINNDKIIFDHTSHLTWQQHGSLESMSLEQAIQWIAELNKIGYANFHNWRLPTLEEAMSLMKKERENGSLFKDHIFGQRQSGIWTSDVTDNKTMAWVVFFNYGSCYVSCFDLKNYVQAVRSLT
jgi:hypothetical protein